MLFLIEMKCAPAPGVNSPAWMSPAFFAAATVGYFSAVERADANSTSGDFCWVEVSGLSGTCSASSSAFTRSPIARDCVVVVTAGFAATFLAAFELDEHAASTNTALTANTTKRRMTAYLTSGVLRR